MNDVTVFRALASELRLQLFSLTLRRPYCVQALARVTGLTESAISQQMRILREAELVTAVKHGYHTHFIADRKRLTAALGRFAEQAEQVHFDADACGCRESDKQCLCGEVVK